jgi:hypothetical protein
MTELSDKYFWNFVSIYKIKDFVTARFQKYQVKISFGKSKASKCDL